jgi:basic membrane protein A and related proteins
VSADTFPLSVGLLMGVGGLGDQSFNDSAYLGLLAVQRQYHIKFETDTWGMLNQNLGTLRRWVNSGYKLIIALSYGHAPAISQVASEQPGQNFAIVDATVQAPNVWSAVFREYEGDFVVGALAALVTRTLRVGFVGGGATPVVRRIEAGFAQGVAHINPNISILSDYVGVFDDPARGRLLAETQYASGADVILQAAGRCGLGAIEAAKSFGRYIISTGADHSELAPHAVLTSRVKRVDNAVYDVIESVVQGNFQGGVVHSYGFAEDGLTIAPFRPEVADVVTPEIQTRLQQIKEDVASGKIQVKLDPLDQ